ncbi:hypothetical protein FLK61_38120 [Paenalkalicoccus suaedae]|uniref:Uncharacterized protein n=1 Tax=Paenalkalicoccus suaedae TaxID=2592382 RepID=A0A859FHY2_9BACI|nr:hypothetical protein [Paenalkalicoccus suaedae]QKS72448.1 hypothetical protein FLK61_38120 [Paenalkalicoccus suaedae]
MVKRVLTVFSVFILLLSFTFIGETTAIFNDEDTTTPNETETAELNVVIDNKADINFSIDNMIPGDFRTQTITVANTGSVPFIFDGYFSRDDTTDSTVLWDGSNGLFATIDGISVTNNGAPLSFSEQSSQISDITETTAIPFFELAPGDSVDLSITLALPTEADNTYQNQTESFTFTIYAEQLAGGER